MKSELPAEGIMKTHDWGNSKMFRVSCQCGNPDDDIDFEIEADDNSVTVTTYTTQKTNFWYEQIPVNYNSEDPWYGEVQYATTNIWNGFIRRCKLTWDIWFKGYVKYQQSTVMTEQQAINYADTLKIAVMSVKEFQVSNHKDKK